MNLTQLLNDSHFDEICIPRLQRDYAQGRRTPKIDDIRNTLLSEIFSGKKVHLNMIFGDVDDKTIEGRRRFIPIDGQQRLTTLFLLYVYRCKMLRKGLEKKLLEKFTYETRRSSTDFIKQLVANEWPKNIEPGKFLQTIRNENWYRLVWDDDPTVVGMLVMLNDIHNHAKNKNLDSSADFPDLDAITFDFENLKDLGLNETLYIKMNSRGLELNNFEIVKCSIENTLPDGHIPGEQDCFKAYVYEDNIEGIRNETFAYQWRWCMDRKWSDWFWNPFKKEGETNFLKFLTIYSIGFYAAYAKDSQAVKAERFKEMHTRLSQNTLSWEHLIKGIEDKRQYFIRLAKLLSRIISIDGVFKSSWGDIYSFKDESKMENKTFAVLFAVSCYEGDTLSEPAFDEWMRVCFNLIEYINSAESFTAFCGQIKDFTDISTDILNGLQNVTTPLSDRIEQEKIKASLLLQGVEMIRAAEKHQLFRGNIRQLLVDADNKFTGKFNDAKWDSITRYFNDEGLFRGDFEIDFVVAFLKSCNQENQLNNDSEILNFSPENIRTRLIRQRYVSVFHNILISESLRDVQCRKITNSDEWEQYRNAIASHEVVSAILKRSRRLQFGSRGMEFLFRKGSWSTSNDYIALDYTLPDGTTRYRNSFLAMVGYDGDRVAENHNLWWAADVTFDIDGHKYEWNVWNWIYPLDSNGNRMKNNDGSDIRLNAHSVEKNDLREKLLNLLP